MTLPHFLEVIDVNNSNDVAVIAKEHIPMKTQLGPFEAKRTIYDYNRKGIFYLKVCGWILMRNLCGNRCL